MDFQNQILENRRIAGIYCLFLLLFYYYFYLVFIVQ